VSFKDDFENLNEVHIRLPPSNSVQTTGPISFKLSMEDPLYILLNRFDFSLIWLNLKATFLKGLNALLFIWSFFVDIDDTSCFVLHYTSLTMCKFSSP
jgi:hypothetical protein